MLINAYICVSHDLHIIGVWEAMEMLNQLVDDSDPDVGFIFLWIHFPHSNINIILDLQTDVSQIEHLLQTAEAIRRDGKPEWMQVTGLVHDLGKLLYMFDSEGQWDVVGVSPIRAGIPSRPPD